MVAELDLRVLLRQAREKQLTAAKFLSIEKSRQDLVLVFEFVSTGAFRQLLSRRKNVKDLRGLRESLCMDLCISMCTNMCIEMCFDMLMYCLVNVYTRRASILRAAARRAAAWRAAAQSLGFRELRLRGLGLGGLGLGGLEV